jgi:hypothetical protein
MGNKIILFILTIALGISLNAQDTQADKQEKEQQKKKTEKVETNQTTPVIPPAVEKDKSAETTKTQPETTKEKILKEKVAEESPQKTSETSETKPADTAAVDQEKDKSSKETDKKEPAKEVSKRQSRKHQLNTLIKHSLEKTGFSIYEFKYSRFNNDNAFLFGGGGGLIFNNTFSFGGKIYLLLNQYYSPANIQFPNESMEMVYGGMYLEKIFFWRNLIHFSVGSLFGAGVIALNDRSKIISLNENEYDLFFVIEPDITLIMNLTRNLHLRLGAGYRFISGIERIWTNNNTLTNTSITLGIQIEE